MTEPQEKLLKKIEQAGGIAVVCKGSDQLVAIRLRKAGILEFVDDARGKGYVRVQPK